MQSGEILTTTVILGLCKNTDTQLSFVIRCVLLSRDQSNGNLSWARDQVLVTCPGQRIKYW